MTISATDYVMHRILSLDAPPCSAKKQFAIEELRAVLKRLSAPDRSQVGVGEAVAYRVKGLGWDEYLPAKQALQLQLKVPGLEYDPLFARPTPIEITDEMVGRMAGHLFISLDLTSRGYRLEDIEKLSREILSSVVS